MSQRPPGRRCGRALFLRRRRSTCRQAIELGMTAQPIEIGFVGDQSPQLGFLFERGGQRVQRLGRAARQGPVARQVVGARVPYQGSHEARVRANRWPGRAGWSAYNTSPEPVRPGNRWAASSPPFRAVSEPHGNVSGCEALPPSGGLPRTACSTSPNGCRGSGAPSGQLEHQETFCLVELPLDLVATDPTHRRAGSHGMTASNDQAREPGRK